ncbi:DUF4838 domain-containing protein [Chitinophaga nivalis]|uniref:DUF4838 domain-containing protein n=1 Tax=Chitinophaga nivalis TaxID=2991709 RepID=A0ABT3IHH2_9BACT|nr:DUF4838 domain-containing protein [Chitinophaga nivalis]MCW3466912.1 DUF4838 domain-containing protein [Chitinophaga nivalis]MCW3483397.1 DUF4838 domain-containing protein [Chitinophaga nivalis]
MSGLLLMMTMWWHTAFSGNSQDINLVHEGKSAYVIVVPAQASKAEQRAAGIFRNYIEQISGARLTVIPENEYHTQPAVFIGQTDHSHGPEQIKGEGYFIGSEAPHLYIRGGSGQGVVYGVYHVLETYMGCRKDAGEPAVVPASRDIRLPGQLHDLQEPAFLYRETYYPASLDPEYLEWHGLHRFEDLWSVWGHSFFRIVPPDTYFNTHPEYFSLVNGRRQPLQLCLSNEQVYDLAVAYFKQAIAKHPDAGYWSIAQEDGPGACTCDACRQADAAAGGPQGSLIRFVNRIAAQFPEQRFTTLAYGYSARPPQHLRPASNVYIMLSTIDAFRQEPLATAPSAAPFRKNLEGWAALTPNLFIWDYTTQFTHYLTPFPDYAQLQPNLQYFARHGVKGIFSQGSGAAAGDMAAYNSYVQACLLWNPQAAVTAVSERFLRSYYGAAGPYIQQYLAALTQAVKDTRATLDIYGNPVRSSHDYLSAIWLKKYNALLDQATAAVKNEATLLKRVEQVRLSLTYTALQQSRFYGTADGGYLHPDGTIRAGWREKVRAFAAGCQRAGITELAEGGLSPEGYVQDWERTFSQPWIPSLALGAPVTLAHAFTPEYTPKGAATLTDGLFGNSDFSYNWLYTYGQDLIATIDMGSSKPLRRISLHFLQDARHYIFNPVNVTVEVSADGKHFQAAGEQSIPAGAEDYTVRIQPYLFPQPGVTGRYIRITARCPASLPEWRLVAGKKPALCCDEVSVE